MRTALFFCFERQAIRESITSFILKLYISNILSGSQRLWRCPPYGRVRLRKQPPGLFFSAQDDTKRQQRSRSSQKIFCVSSWRGEGAWGRGGPSFKKVLLSPKIMSQSSGKRIGVRGKENTSFKKCSPSPEVLITQLQYCLLCGGRAFPRRPRAFYT